MTKRNNTLEYDNNNDPRDEFGELHLGIKIQNVILIISSIIYTIALFVPIVYERVYDAGIVYKYDIFKIGVTALAFLDKPYNEISVLSLIPLVSTVCLIMTFMFLASSINHYVRCERGYVSLLGRNIFFLISIPLSHLLVIGNISNSNMITINYMPVIALLIIGAIATLLVFIFGIGKYRVSVFSTLEIVIAIACLASVLACMYNPIFDVTFESVEDRTPMLQLDVDDFSDFYRIMGIDNHRNSMKKAGMVKFFTGNDSKLQSQSGSNDGEALADILMMKLPAYTPSMMLISLFIMSASSFAILGALLDKAFAVKKKRLGMIIAKVILAISTSTFFVSIIQINAAVADVKAWLAWLPTVNININSSFESLILTVTLFPVIAIAASILMLLFNVRGRYTVEQ